MTDCLITAHDLLTVVKEHEGYHEQPDGGTKFAEWYAARVHNRGFRNAAWCDMFLAWCSYEAGRRKGGAAGGETALKQTGCFAYTPYHAQDFAAHSRFGNTPTVGSFAFFDWQSGRSIDGIDHIEIVAGKTADGYLITYGGNVRNKVSKSYRSRRNIIGFGYPTFAKSAEKPVPVITPATAGKPTKRAPKYPLPRGHVFGVPSAMPSVHSGTTAADKKAIATLQQRFRDRGWRITADGEYGPQTKGVVLDFQADKGLERDGLAGPITWNAAWTAPVT